MKLPIAWCAPECINVLRFTSASDVYAYGVTLWEMFSYGKMPWEGCTGAQVRKLDFLKEIFVVKKEGCLEKKFWAIS